MTGTPGRSASPALSAQAALVVRRGTAPTFHEGVLITTGAIRAAPSVTGRRMATAGVLGIAGGIGAGQAERVVQSGELPEPDSAAVPWRT